MSKILKNNTPLIGFVLGILTVVTFVPIATSFAELVCQWFEYLKTKPIEKTSKKNIKIARLQRKLEEESMPTNTQAIGFEMPQQEELYGDYCRNKIGFNG